MAPLDLHHPRRKPGSAGETQSRVGHDCRWVTLPSPPRTQRIWVHPKVTKNMHLTGERPRLKCF